jgi:magnesium chelatase family protein
MLRVPLESGSITLCRAGRTTSYPAQFQLLMAVNPCPCGNSGSKTKICLCSSKSIDQYWKKFSAPLLDRVELRVFVENNSESENPAEERERLISTDEIRKGVALAVKTQRQRQGVRNEKLLPQEVQQFCEMSMDARKVLDNAVMRYGFSPRAVSGCMKVARTIADIDGCELIQKNHVAEAVEYRKLCVNTVPEFDMVG